MKSFCSEGLPEEPLLNFYLNVDGPVKNIEKIIDGIKRLSWVRITKIEYVEDNSSSLLSIPEKDRYPYSDTTLHSSATLVIEKKLRDSFRDLLKELGFQEV